MQPTPPPDVFDLFAVPPHPVPVDGGQGHSVRAGDLVLSPGRDPATAQWLNPVLARLAADLDHEQPRSLRIAMPVPTRDLRWVVDGWGASRFEPGSRPCRDLNVLRASARLLHAHLAAVVTDKPIGLAGRDDRWARADRATFGDNPPRGILGDHLASEWEPGVDLGAEQLVHGDLAGNVLVDASSLPLVLDVAPYWRPALWAEALVVLDAVRWLDADPTELREWNHQERRQAMLRAALFRLLSDPVPDPASYRALLLTGQT